MASTISSVIIIPARMASERFPGKPMAMAGGKPLLEWTWLRAQQTNCDHVLIATPDREIGQYCQDKGILWRPSSEELPTGTHRCADVAAHMKRKFDVVVDWQVDEPLVDPQAVDRLVDFVQNRRDVVGTLAAPFVWDEFYNTNVVKVAVSKGENIHPKDQNRCNWFSRGELGGSMAHIGVYAFGWHTLGDLGRMPPTMLSKAESLEQLAWIERGIRVFEVDAKLPLSINTPEDFEKFKADRNAFSRG